MVRIQGTGFSVRGVQHLGGEGRVESNFTVRIGGRALPAALVTDGTGEQELEVTVPADLPPGLHDVEVVDPYGTSAVLHGGFVESVGPPPSLSVRVDGPARSETGAPVDVVVTVDNGGGETATAVAVSFEAQTLAGGASVRPGDRLSLNVALPDPGLGPHEFVVAVSGTDGVTGLPLEAVTALARVDFVSPPTLRAVTYPPPAAVDVSQPFELRVDLTNDGDVDALAVQVVLDPDAALTAISPEPQDVPAGTTRTFILGARGTLPGIAAPRARALGSDALTSNPMPPLEALWPGIEVQMPAALRVAAITAPGAVSVGQEFEVEALVANDGDAAALDVQDLSAAAANLAIVSAPPQQQVAGHAVASFRWRLRADAAGTGTLVVSLSGADANSGWAAAATALAPLLVQAPASLSVDSVSMPSSLSRGQAFTLTAVIRNQGGASAVSLQRSYSVASAGGAAASCTPVAGPTALAGGSAGTFTWWCIENGTAAGALTVSVAASAVDANSLVAISAAPLPGTPATVQRPAALEIASVVLPAALSRGQSFTLVATLSNTGEAAATGVQFSAPQTVATGGANAACTPSSASSSVAGATSVAFSWSCQESGANSGTLSFTVHVTAADVNSGAAVSAAAGSAAAAVQQPASLAVSSLVAPSRLSRGQTWTAELTVRNAGEASARAVTPDLASAVSGGAGVSVVAAPAVQDVPGGESAIFSWTLRESGTSTGSITLDAGVSGVDENGGASLSARAGTPAIPVQQPASVSIDGVSLPLLLSRGQSFPVTAVVRNDGGARVVSMQVPASAVAVGGAAASCTAQVAPVSIAGGTSATYSWACRENGTSTGSLAFSVSAIGLDENSSAALSSGPVSSGTATVEQPAVLAASLATGPSLSRGQAFTVVSTVTNAGDARAIGVQPGPLAIAGAGGANAICIPNWTSSSIDGGTVATFAWNCLESGSGSGTLTFEAQLTGMDENSGAALTASTAPFTSAVQQPAALRISSVSAPTALSRGQGFTISVTVSNEGEALAEAVGAAALATTANGGPAVLVLASPGTQDIVGGASATYSWSSRENGAGPGTLQLTASFSGADGNSGAAVSVTATTSLIAVQTPAALTIDSVSLPSPLSQGQPFTLAAEITNSGGAAAVGLKAAPPVVSASGGAAATCVPQSAPSSIPGGASATFSWSCDENGASTGALAFAVSASGADGNSAAPIAAGPVSSPTVSVQAPADLSISSWTVPAVLSRGQTFTVMAGVSNNAEATARSVEPGTLMIIATGGANATCTASFVPTDLAGGGTASFSWNCAETGMSSGTLAFAVQASGTDANSGSLVTSPLSTSTTHAVQEPAALSVASFMLPSALSSGQTFTVTLVLANTGQANARAVLPSALSPTTTGAAALAVSSAPAAQDVAGGQSVTFTWTCRESGTGPGTLQIAATASGTDANSGAIVGAGGSTPAATVQTAAGLAIESIAVPAAITRGQTFEIVATVRNSGGATARSVTPSQPTVVATGAAAATTTSTQAPADIAGGASATFTWRYRESGSGSGTLAFGVAASGTDANSGTTTVARAVTSSAFPVQQPPLLSISAFTAQSSLGSTTVNTGQSFTLTMTLANGGEAPAAGVLANPHPPSQTATGGAQATVTALLRSPPVRQARTPTRARRSPHRRDPPR